MSTMKSERKTSSAAILAVKTVVGLKRQRSQDREVPMIEKQRVPLQDRDKAHDDH